MKRLLAAAALAAAAVVVGVAPSQAAPAAQVSIREVDTTAWPTVRMVVLTPGQATPTFNIRDGATLVEEVTVGEVGKTARRVGTVLAIDESASMVAGGRIEGAKAAAHQFVDRMRPTDEVGVVAFSDTARVLAPMTSDKAALSRAIDGLSAHGESALWDGVQMATGLLQARPQLQANIVVLSDGKDTKSTATSITARASALAAKAVVFGVGVGGGAQAVPDPDGLAAIAEITGGSYADSADAATLSTLFGRVQDAVQGQHELSFTALGSDARDVTVSVNGGSARVSVVPGVLATGANAHPAVVHPAKAPGFLSGGAGLFLIIVLVIAAVGLFARAVAMTVTRPLSHLDTALAAYTERPAGELEEDDEIGTSLVESRFVKSAVDSASKLAPARRILDSLGDKLEQANLPLRAEEVAFVYAVVGTLATVLALLFLGPILALMLVGGLVLLPPAVLSFMIRRRTARFTRQLPDALNLLSGTLRAGFSLMQGVEAMATEVGEPMGHELRRVLAEARLGRSLDEALNDMAVRLKSADFEWTVMAIGIQRAVGGNLAELLETVADTMHARERLRADVKALTAEGRVSAIVIGAMPPVLLMVMSVMNKAYVQILFTDVMGQFLLAASGLLAVFGFWWMKKTIEIEV